MLVRPLLSSPWDQSTAYWWPFRPLLCFSYCQWRYTFDFGEAFRLLPEVEIPSRLLYQRRPAFLHSQVSHLPSDAVSTLLADSSPPRSPWSTYGVVGCFRLGSKGSCLVTLQICSRPPTATCILSSFSIFVGECLAPSHLSSTSNVLTCSLANPLFFILPHSTAINYHQQFFYSSHIELFA